MALPMQHMLRGRTISLLLTIVLLIIENTALGDAQSLSHISPRNAPLAGGATITLFGISLGNNNNQPTPTAYLGSLACQTTVFNSFTSIACQTPDMVSTNNAVSGLKAQIVRADQGWSLDGGTTPNLDNGFSYDSAVITDFVGTNSAQSGASTVTIHGMNFGSADLTMTGYVGQSNCATTVWTTSSAIKCVVAAGTGGSVQVRLGINSPNLFETKSAVFTYDAPAITMASATNVPPSYSSTVTISGLNFGNPSIDPTPTVSIGTFACGTTAWSSSTTLQCQLGTGAGTNAFLATIDSVASEGYGSFVYDAPIYSSTSVSANAPVSGGNLVTVYGVNFASTDISHSISVGKTLCATTSWSTATAVACSPNEGTGNALYSGIIVNNAIGSLASVFTYDSPVLTYVFDRNAPVTAGATVTVNGMNFASHDASLSVRLGNTLCSSGQKWTSSTTVTCGVPLGQPVDRVSVTAELGSVIGTLYLGFTYDGPVLTNINPVFGPTTGGTEVTITGFNFGSSANEMTAAIAGSAWYPEGPCATLSWRSDNEMICTTSGGAGASISVYVTAGGAEFRLVNAFSFHSPEITSVSAYNSPTSAGMEVTILGDNFGSVDRSPEVRLGLSQCATASWTSVTQMTCVSDVGYGNGLDVSVNVRDLIGCLSAAFTYDVPSITFLLDSNAPLSVGSSMTVTGNNFATSNTSPTIQVGSTICATTSWTTNSAVMCAPAAYYPVITGSPSQSAKALTVSVTAGNQEGKLADGFTYDLPVITSLFTTNAAATTGASVTISGLNFGSMDNSATVKVGQTSCTTTSWSSSTTLSCKTANGVGSALNLILAINSGGSNPLVSTGFALFSYNVPIVSRVTLQNGASTAGTTITLQGTNFGAVSSVAPVVQIGDTACTATQWIANTQVQCQLPSGAGRSRRAYVTAGGASGYQENGFTYDTPVVTHISTVNAPNSAGASLTVHGLNFAPSDETASVAVGGTGCGTTSWSTSTSLVCKTDSDGYHVQHAVSTFLGTEGKLLTSFSWDAPVISITEVWNSPTSGGVSVTVSGINFGAYELSATVFVGSTACETSSWNSVTSVACLVKPSTGSAITANMRLVSASVGTAMTSFSFDSPVVTNVLTYNGATSAGSSVTVLGINFANDGQTVSVKIGMSLCGTTSWSTATSVTCLTASGYDAMLSINPIVNSVMGTLVVAFSYDAPSITHVARFNAPTTQGASITFSGHNFAPSDYSVTASVSGTICATSSWVTQTSVFCLTAAGTGPSHLVAVTLGSMTGTLSQAFTFDASVVTAISAVNGPVSAKHMVTVLGINFGAEDSTVSAKMLPTQCGTASWTSSTTITCEQIGELTHETLNKIRTVQVEVTSIMGTIQSMFSYDAPVVTQTFKPNAPLSSQASVTILGFNFGTSDLSVTGRVGLSVCTSTKWLAQTAVRCGVEPGSGLMHGIGLTMGAVVSTQFLGFSYDTPVVTFINSYNAPTTAGGTVTVSGVNFGSSDLTVSINVGKTGCHTTSWTTTSSVMCTSPEGKGTAHSVTMTITSNVGTGNAAFTYDAPVMTHFMSLNAPTLGASSVSIFGTNFGISLLAQEKAIVARIGKTDATEVRWISATSLLAITPKGVGTHPPGLVIEELTSTVSHLFTYNAPVIQNVSPNSPSTGGGTVTLSGFNFGAEDSTPSAAVRTKATGHALCKSTKWLTTTSVTCATAPGLGTVASVMLTVSENVGCQVGSFTYDSPVVTQVFQPNGPVTANNEVTIVGTNFGIAESVDTVVRGARVGATQCLTQKWRSDSAVICSLAPGYGHGNAQSLTISAQVGTFMDSFSYDSPVVSHVTRPNAPTTSSATITVFGHNFVAGYDVSPRIRVGKTLCRTSSWSSNSMMKCVSPAGTGAGYKVSLTVADLVATQQTVFSYGAPVLTYVSLKNAATSGGTLITIMGKNFGLSNPSPTATIGSSKCKRTQWLTTTSITCFTSSGVGSEMLVSLNTNKQTGTIMAHFSYDAPVVTSTQGVSNGPTRQGTQMTVLGFNFGQFGDSKGVQVRVGGAYDETGKSVKWISPTSLTSRTPNGAGAAVEIAVTLSSQIGTLSAAYTFDAAVITELRKGGNAAVSGGAIVTIHGRNFGMKDFKQTARVGQTMCDKTTWQSDTSLFCTAAVGVGHSLAVSADVSSVTGTAITVFTYDSPVVTIISPVNGPTTGSSMVTIRGLNFGSVSEPKDIRTEMAGVCALTVWMSNSQVLCRTPAKGQGKDISAVVAVNGIHGTGFKHFTYDDPVVTHVVHANSPATGAAVATVQGINFGTTNPVATIGKTACFSTVWVTDSTVACTVSDGMQDPAIPIAKGKPGKIGLRAHVAVGGNEGELKNAFTYDPPLVSAIFTPNAPISGNNIVTLTGRNFGDSTVTPRASIGPSSCTQVGWVSDSAITCTGQAGNGYQHDVLVTAGPLTGPVEMRYSYDTPVLTAFLPANAPPSSSSTVTIFGMNFGRLNREPVVGRVGMTNCKTTVWFSSTHAMCAVAPGMDNNRDVTLTVQTCPSGNFVLKGSGLDAKYVCKDPLQDSKGSVAGAFSFDSPIVTHYFSRNALPESGGRTITIVGTNFGSLATARGSVGPTYCQASKWLSETSVSCATPSAGDSQVSQLDVAIHVEEVTSQSGSLDGVAFFEDSSNWQAFDTCPCHENTPACNDDTCPPDVITAPTAYLSCGPDREDELNGLDIQKAGILEQGVTLPPLSSPVFPSLTVSATGTAEVSEALVKLPMGTFISDATYSLSIALSGDFSLSVGASSVPQDLIFGLGNSEEFYGVSKNDIGSNDFASFVQGRYDTGTLVECLDPSSGANCKANTLGTVATMENRAWPANKPTSTPTTVKVRFAVRERLDAKGNKEMCTRRGGKIETCKDATINAMQYYTTPNGQRGRTELAQKVITNFELPGRDLGYEVVVFRRYQQQTFDIKQIDINLCGCNAGGTVTECVKNSQFFNL